MIFDDLAELEESQHPKLHFVQLNSTAVVLIESTAVYSMSRTAVVGVDLRVCTHTVSGGSPRVPGESTGSGYNPDGLAASGIRK